MTSARKFIQLVKWCFVDKPLLYMVKIDIIKHIRLNY